MGVYALGIVFWRANSSSWCPSQKEPPRTINLTPVPSLTLNQIKKGCKASPHCNGQPSATMAVPVCPSETDQHMGCALAAIPTFPLPARHTLLLLRVGQQQPVEFNLALPSPATSSGKVSVECTERLSCTVHPLARTARVCTPAAHGNEAEAPLSMTSLRETVSNKMMLSTSDTFARNGLFWPLAYV